MEIEALGKKWEINGIGYAPSRKLRVKTLQSLRKAYVTDSEDVDIDSFYEQQEHERYISQSNAELERGKREVEEWRENRRLLGHDMAEAIEIQRELEDY